MSTTKPGRAKHPVRLYAQAGEHLGLTHDPAMLKLSHVKHMTRKDVTMKTIIHTPEAPAAVGPYSQAVKLIGPDIAAGLVFSAGQLGIDPATGSFASCSDPNCSNPDFVAQTQQAMRNLKAVLEAADSSIANIVKTTIFVTDLTAFKDVNAAYSAFLQAEGVTEFPARSTVQVAALPLGGHVEIEVIALLNDPTS